MGNENSGRKKKPSGQKVLVSGRIEPELYEKFNLVAKQRGWKTSQVVEYFVGFAIENQNEFDKWFSNRLK